MLLVEARGIFSVAFTIFSVAFTTSVGTPNIPDKFWKMFTVGGFLLFYSFFPHRTECAAKPRLGIIRARVGVEVRIGLGWIGSGRVGSMPSADFI